MNSRKRREDTVVPKTGQAGGAHARKSSGGPWRVVFIVSILVFVCALAALGAIVFSYWQGQQTNKEIAEIGIVEPAPETLAAEGLSSFKVDWDALRAVNPDVVGWIYVPGTNINYPIVHTTDDEYYLKHDFKGSVGWIATFGAIFLSADNQSNFSDANNIIYGHHLNDGSMFSAFASFGDADTFNASRTIYILSPTTNYALTTFSIVHCAADDPIAQIAFTDEAERVSYLQDKIDRSVVVASGIPAAKDIPRTFAFSTCDNLASDGRWVLFAYVSEASTSDDITQSIANPEDAAAVDEAAKESVS